MQAMLGRLRCTNPARQNLFADQGLNSIAVMSGLDDRDISNMCKIVCRDAQI